jgi:transcriptional regulator
MYLKSQFKETRIDVLHGLVRANPLGMCIVCVDSQPVVNHIPFLVSSDGGEFGTLMTHIPRANPVWESFDGDRNSLVVFHGANSYISPSWYPSKKEHGKVVPTWNYVVVHASGRPRAILDRQWIRNHLRELTYEHESGLPDPWKLSDAPESYIDEMVSLLIGIEIPIESLIGKWKVNQNRPTADRVGVIAALESIGDDRSKEMASLVRERNSATTERS